MHDAPVIWVVVERHMQKAPIIPYPKSSWAPAKSASEFGPRGMR